MARQVFKVLVPVGLMALLSALLFGGYLTTSQIGWLQLVAVEIRAAGRDTGTQWIVVVCLLVYFVTFLILERRLNSAHPGLLPGRSEEGGARARFAFLRGQIRNPDFWLFGFILLVLVRYAVDYANSAKSLQVVVLMAGIVMGKGVALWVGWGDSQSKHSTLNIQHPTSKNAFGISIDRTQVFLWGLVLLLAAAVLWQPDIGTEFHYRGIRRWEGVWENPNTYGLLMGVGLTLAIGLIGTCVWRPGERKEHSTFNAQRPTLKIAWWLWLLAAAGLCGLGLLKSYSRGAWLGTVSALGLLTWSWTNRTHLTPALSPRAARGERGILACRLWLRRNWLPSSFLLLSILVICFWQFRHTESPLLRRVFSVGNVNDFSWRNRVTAWQGAGRMMLDKPMIGFGWGSAEEAYRKEYRAERLEETAAVQLNDYLMIGISAGLAALLCLVIYFALVMIAVTGEFRNLTPADSPVKAERGRRLSACNIQLSTTAATGASVLLIGFWFDGGLFKLPTCVVFWILLELARCGGRSNEIQTDRVRIQESSLAGLEAFTAKNTKHSRPELALRWLAALATAAAIGQTALHQGLPQCVASPRIIAVARNWLVPVWEKADFEFLAARPVWSDKPLKTLLQHALLAGYNRELVNWKLDDSIYQSFVLAPEIDPAFDGMMNWRRPLWEHFYPRIRKDGSTETAAEVVIRELRHRVKISTTDDVAKTMAEMWQCGEASAPGFEALSVAALRSVGIPARLLDSGQGEFWNGAEWKPCVSSVLPTVR